MRFGLPFCLTVLPQATACMQKGEGETMIMVTVQKSSWRRFFAMLGCAVALSGVFLGVNSLADGARAAEAAARAISSRRMGGRSPPAPNTAMIRLGFLSRKAENRERKLAPLWA